MGGHAKDGPTGPASSWQEEVMLTSPADLHVPPQVCLLRQGVAI